MALGLAVALLGSARVAAADPGTGPMVTATIYAAGGGTSTTSVSAAQLLADPQNCPAYTPTTMTEYSASGSTAVGLPAPSGSGTGTWPLSTILHCLQNPVANVQSITILNGDGSPQVSAGAQLSAADLASPSDFQTASESPVVSNLGSSFQYNRPWRGQGDLNADDQVTSSDPIAIEVFQGSPLTVTAAASTSSPGAGAAVSFSATVTGNQGAALTYQWTFGDNLPQSTVTGPTVAYTDAGSYTVTVQVTDATGGAGATTVPVTVSGPSTTSAPTSPPPATGAPNTGTTPNAGSGPTSGNGKGSGTKPSTGNGNTGRNSNAPAPPTSSHTQKPSHSGGAGASGPSGPAATTTSPSPPSSSSTTSASVPTTPPIVRHSHARSPRPAPGAPTHTTTTAPAGGAPGQLVTGRLIADVTPLAAGASPLVHVSPGSAAAAAAAAAAPRHTHPLPLIAGCLAVALLLGLGAARELHGPSWRRRPRLSS